MLCYGPLMSELGAQNAWCPLPRHWGAVPLHPTHSAAYDGADGETDRRTVGRADAVCCWREVT